MSIYHDCCHSPTQVLWRSRFSSSDEARQFFPPQSIKLQNPSTAEGSNQQLSLSSVPNMTKSQAMGG